MKSKNFIPLVLLLLILSATPVSAYNSGPLAQKTPEEIEAWREANRKTPEEIEAYKEANQKTPEEIEAYKQANQKTAEEIEAERARLREVKSTPSGELIQKREEIRQENLSKLTEIKQKLVNRVYANIEKQLANRYQVLLDSQKKIEARISEMNDEAVDTSSVTAKLAEIEAYKTSYQSSLTQLAAQIQALQQSNTPFKEVPSLRLQAKNINDSLKNIRQIEVEAIKLLISLK